MPAARILIIVVHFLVGLNGLAGGFAALSQPEGPFGIPLSVLKNGPFRDFLLPGLALFVVIGLGNVAVGATVVKRFRHHDYLVGLIGLVTLGWIAIQVYVMEEINFMHVTIFILGLLQCGYALYALIHEDKFPFNAI